jgi:hypothetical protein
MISARKDEVQGGGACEHRESGTSVSTQVYLAHAISIAIFRVYSGEKDEEDVRYWTHWLTRSLSY